MTVKEMLYESVNLNQSLLAHAIFLAVQEGKVDMEQPAASLNFSELDLARVKKMSEDNLLAMNKVTLYACPLKPGYFAFILAHNEQEVRKEFVKVYGRQPSKVLEMESQMNRTMYFSDSGKYMDFWEIKNQVKSFPYFVCEFEKENRVIA